MMAAHSTSRRTIVSQEWFVGLPGSGEGHVQQTTCSWDEMSVVHTSEQLSNYPIHRHGRGGMGDCQHRKQPPAPSVHSVR